MPVLDPVSARGVAAQDAGARSEDAVVERASDGAVALLGRGADLGQPDHDPQSDDGREGPRLVHLARPAAREPGVLPQGLGPSVGEGVPARAREPPPFDVRPGDRQVHVDQHLLPDPPSRLRRGREQHAVDQRRRAGERRVGWLDRKMFEETGDEQKAQGWTPLILDTNGNGKRDDYVEPDQPVDPARTSASSRRSTASRSTRRRLGLGHLARLPRPRSSGSIPGPIRPQPRSPKSTSRRSRATARAAATSTATACSGPRSRAAISRASTGASARARSTADRDRQALPRGLDALSVPRAAVRDRHGSGLRRGELLHAGSTSSTPSASAGTCRSRPAMPTKSLLALVGGKWSISACPIRSASTPNGWTVASTTRRPAGKARGCGRRRARARRSTSKAARAPGRRS